ncbi:threonine ammonia-lyase [Frigidibacter sp. MR17.24]|uniref:threonine ammonia-lyase n=1 Tax=Frigidibacter sp. MR17.24 TaxID=3127345 RepID=UPI003012BF07
MDTAATKTKTLDLAAIEAAAERIRGAAVRTPLLRNHTLDDLAGAPVLLKAETLQRTGSFKFRGAYNRLSQVPESERPRGVVAWSSGNHAQGVADAARLLGIPATIVMPTDAPALKIENTRAAGAEIRYYDRATESREDIARALVAARGSILVPSYDDVDIMAGQGTVGLEIAEQAKALGLMPERVLICCGGGGLTAGTATALRGKLPRVTLHTVEPEGFEDTARSLAAGERLAATAGARSICDALLAPEPGTLTWRVNRRLIDSGLSVTDDEVRHAMRVAFRLLKLVVEPGGAVTLAALLAGKLPPTRGPVVLVLSGGNVDPLTFADILSA